MNNELSQFEIDQMIDTINGGQLDNDRNIFNSKNCSCDKCQQNSISNSKRVIFNKDKNKLEIIIVDSENNYLFKGNILEGITVICLQCDNKWYLK